MNQETLQHFPVDLDEITHHVKQIFDIESVTSGGAKQGYCAKYTGRLTAANSEAAYDQLAAAVKPMRLTPLFREVEGQQVILLIDELPETTTGPVWVNILLFLLTILSVMFTGAQFAATEMTSPFQQSLAGFLEYLLKGLPFAVSLLGILLAHELGHYLVGRARGETVTLACDYGTWAWTAEVE